MAKTKLESFETNRLGKNNAVETRVEPVAAISERFTPGHGSHLTGLFQDVSPIFGLSGLQRQT